MLYVTTRSKTDSYTDYRTLFDNRAPDGGYFLPFRMPKLSQNQLMDLRTQTFGQNVSFILNLFFSGRITSWDVDCCIGKRPADVISVNHRVLLARLWDNPSGQYRYLCDRLFEKLCAEKNNMPTEWAYIAIRIAVLFGIYGILSDQQIETFDICVPCGDFSDPMAAFYARDMGLPIGNIICVCNDDSPVWDFLHRGELDTGEMSKQNEHAPLALERLIYATLGYEQTQKYLEKTAQEDVYHILPEQLTVLNKGIFVCVVGEERASSVQAAFKGSHHYKIDARTAAAYGGLQDYRFKFGESNFTLLLWDFAPN